MALDPKAEGKRLDDALSRALSELATMRARAQPRLPESDLKVHDGQRMILEDVEFVGRIRDNIANGETAERALHRVMEELSAVMRTVLDHQLRQHVTDFRDVGHRVLRHLRNEEKRDPIQ